MKNSIRTNLSRFYINIKYLIFFKDLHYYSLLVILISLFLYPYFKNGNLFQDLSNYYTPHHHFITSEIREGRLPFWFPNYMFGIPEMFKVDLGLFNPIYLIYYFLNVLFNKNLDINFTHQLREYFIILISILSSLSFFYVFSKYFKDKKNVFVASLVYSINPIIIYYGTWVHGVIYIILPFLTYFIIGLCSKNPDKKNKFFIFLILANYFVISIGYPPFIIYTFLIQLLIVVYLKRESITKFIISYFFSLGLSSFFLIPFFYIISKSSRLDYFPELFGLKIGTILNLFYPYKLPINLVGNFFEFGTFLYLGPILISILFVGVYYTLNNKITFHIIPFLVLLFLYSFADQFNIVSSLSSFIPLNIFRSTFQIVPIIHLILCYLILVGFNSFQSNYSLSKKIIILNLSIILLLFILFTINFPSNYEVYSNSLFSLLQILIFYLFLKNKNYLLFFSLLFYLIYSFNINNIQTFYLNKFSIKEGFFLGNEFFPKELSDKNFRVITTGDNLKNLSYLNINSLFGYDWFFSKKFIELNLLNTIATDWYTFPTFYKTNYDDFNVKYFVSKEIKTIPNFSLIKSVKTRDGNNKELSTYYIYETNSALGRYYVPQAVISCKKNCKQSSDIREKVYFYGIDSEVINTNSTKFKYDIITDNSSIQEIFIKSDYDVFVASTESFDYGWELYINGKKEVLYESSNGFRGFFVTKGNSTVVMKYYPPYLNLGVLISTICFIILIVYLKIDSIKYYFKK